MKVSILTPVHNEETHLAEMISSVLAQSHRDWELLLVDDGSTDGTGRVMGEASAADPRVKVVGDGRKVGKVAAFNAAFAASDGEVIVLLGGDDRLTEDSLSTRVTALQEFAPDGLAIGRFKLRTFSEDPKMHGRVLPRGDLVSSSGGVIAMTRAIADLAFPIDESLVSEDLWIGAVAEDRAETTVDVPHVVLEYRIHPGNSNPRGRDFEQMSSAMAARHRAWELLAASEALLSEEGRHRMAHKAQLERRRAGGSVLSVLGAGSSPLPERLAFASMTNKTLYGLRQRFYMFFSGRRR